MDDRVTTEQGAAGPVPTGAGPNPTPTGQFAASGVLMGILVIVGSMVSTNGWGLSVMCTDDGDLSDCGDARITASMPVVLALVGLVLWCVGWARRTRPDGIGWAWGGVVAGVFGLFAVFG